MKPRSPEKSVGVADAKCWSSMRKWQRCTFLHSMWSSLSLLRNKLLLQRVKVEDRFLRAGHGNDDAPSGNGMLLHVLPGLLFSGLLKPSPAVQMYDVYCGLASFGSYVSDLVICVVMPFSSGLHISPSSPTQAPGTMQRPLAPSEERTGDGDVCASSLPPLAACIRYFPLVPVQPQSSELPATTVAECRRRHSLRRHKGGRWTVRLTSRHHVLQGGCNASLPSVQQDCGGSGGHGSAPGGALTPPR